MKNKFTRLLPLTLLSGLFLALHSKTVAAGQFMNMIDTIGTILGKIFLTPIAALAHGGDPPTFGVVAGLLLLLWAVLYYLFRKFVITDEKFTWQAAIASGAISAITVLASPIASLTHSWLKNFFGPAAMTFLLVLGVAVVILIILFIYMVAVWASKTSEKARAGLLGAYGEKEAALGELAKTQQQRVKDQEEGARIGRAERDLTGLQQRSLTELRTLTTRALPANLPAALSDILNGLREAQGGALDDKTKKTYLARLSVMAAQARDFGNITTKQMNAWNKILNAADELYTLVGISEADALKWLKARASAAPLSKAIKGFKPAGAPATFDKNAEKNEALLKKITADVKALVKEQKDQFSAWDGEVIALADDTKKFEKKLGDLAGQIEQGNMQNAIADVTWLLNEQKRITDWENAFQRICNKATQLYDNNDTSINARLMALSGP